MKVLRALPADRRRLSLTLVALVAAAVTLLLRVPFAADRLWDHDSVQFALAVADFDLAAHTPHPPGYPLYVGVLKALAAVGVRAADAMVALSILFQALGAALIAPVAARLAGARVPGQRLAAEQGGAAEGAPAAIVAATLFATNPLVWFYGELPLVYGVEAGLTVLLAWAALGMADGRGRFLAACALFGLAGGIRPSTLVLLAPLFLAGLGRAWWARRRAGTSAWRLGVGDLVLGATAGALAVAAWLLPLLADAGGLSAYRRIGGEHFAALLPHTSILYGAGWPALAHNVELLTKWAVQGLVPAGAVLAVLAVLAPRGVVRGLRLLAWRAGWIAVWAAPPIAFFALFHVTKAGYTLIHLPALLVAAALAAAPALAARPRRATAAALVAAAVGCGLFLFGADRRDDQPRWLAAVRHEHNAAAIATYQRDLDALLAVLEALPADRTLLATVELSGTGAAGPDGFLYPYHRHLQWYAPAHPVGLLVPEHSFALLAPGGRQDFQRTGPTLDLPPAIDRVVFVLASLPGDRLRLPPGEVLLANPTFVVLAAPLGAGIEVGPLVLRSAAARRRAA